MIYLLHGPTYSGVDSVYLKSRSFSVRALGDILGFVFTDNSISGECNGNMSGGVCRYYAIWSSKE